jgi:integrase/recombinase XerD
LELMKLFKGIELGEIFFPYRTAEDVMSLKYRTNAYLYPITRDLHFGIYKPSPDVCNWICRRRLGPSKYEQRSLLVAVDGGVLKNSILDAFEAFCNLSDNANHHSDKRKFGRSKFVHYCEISSDVVTIGKILYEYCNWLEVARSKSTHYGAVVLLNYHLIPYFSNFPVLELKSEHMIEVARRIFETPPKHGFGPHVLRNSNITLSRNEITRRKRTFNSLMTHLRGAVRYSAEGGNLEIVKVLGLIKSFPVQSKPNIFFLNIKEINKVLIHCEENLKNLALASLYSGCRVGELSSLKVKDIGRGGFGLRIGSFKHGPGRFVFLSDEGMNFFRCMSEGRNQSDLVFTTQRGKKWAKHHIVPFQLAVKKAGISERFTFHGLRHTYASYLLMSGVSLEVVAKQLGHKSILTTVQTYGHIADSFRESEIRKKFSFDVNHSAHLFNCDRPRLSEIVGDDIE